VRLQDLGQKNNDGNGEKKKSGAVSVTSWQDIT